MYEDYRADSDKQDIIRIVLWNSLSCDTVPI